MNLHNDESLKQEVIYLHSLWHQGPPTRNPIPSPRYNPFHDPVQRSRPNYIPPADLQLLSRYGAVGPQIISRNPIHPQFLHNNKRPRPDSDREWPVKELLGSSPHSGSRWPDFKPCKKARPVSEEEKAKFAVNQLQRDIHRTCREFFGRTSGEEGGDGSDTDDGDEDQSSEKEGSSSKEFQFLSRLFEENGKLKEYYEKNTGNGEFWCLVCGGTGEKSCRKFKSCLALIQHSLAIHKTDLKNQHRALAQVICNVLGWDVDNPVASSQKDAQILGVEAVAEGATEPPSDQKKPQEKQHVMSVDEQAKTAVLQMQQNASDALKGIFAKDTTAGSVDEFAEKGVENLSEELELISRLFSENVELKSYYEKNCEGGLFVCLVCCAATDKKMIKRFKHCYGLVLHSTKNPKMNKRAHKAFARFVCELLGWEFDRLPRRAVKGGAPLVECNANQENEKKPSSMIEEHMCEDKSDNPQDNNEACVG
ncbi:hypothetical protein EUTSA_v10018481mg [Eutrema salsugineum]|uniref:Uncharacterized protein n=2 Tax=Eutrema salsugineum TaxID=72664 RepID=V4KBX9_EUTSA|nr:uncharacterized protein LOC18008617 isoform X3 [Eutrema salsugineum]XP_024006474.1 uncharacterized protein LOC18008617 isoform X2 [Eutrema salsugineum]ESQ27242.1 hypothetical protein EUTSA_v10018481mg [Eutrema salsugineum]